MSADAVSENDASARACRGRWVLHTREYSTSVETAESCRTAMPVAAAVGLPCAQTPFTAHGRPTTTHTGFQKSPYIQRKPALVLQRSRPPMCNTNRRPRPPDTPHHALHRDRSTSASRSARFSPANPTSRHAQQARGRRPHTAPQNRQRTADPQQRNRSRGGLRPISSRNRTELDAGCDRSRAGTGPISSRVTTDLGAEPDRSRAGLRPISVRNRTDLGAECDRSRCGTGPISAESAAVV